MKFKLLFCAYLAMISSTALFADVAVPYGEGSGKVDFFNYKKYPRLEDPYPTGPLSFRIVGDKTWVADSVGNKLIQYGKDGKFVSEFSVLPDGVKPYTIKKFDKFELPISNSRIEDMAPVYGEYGDLIAWWVIDGIENKLTKFSVDGKKVAEIKHPDFKQPFRVEVGRGGYIFVADKICRAILIFDSNGKFYNKQSWEWSGMAVAGADDILYRLMWDNEAHRNVLVSSNIQGKVLFAKMLEVEMFDPRLWWVDESKGECLITYTPLEGFKGKLNVVRVGFDGKVKGSSEMPAPAIMNRIIDHMDYTDVYIGKCNFFEAPEGKFEVVPFKMP
jgi:hypothetical protein